MGTLLRFTILGSLLLLSWIFADVHAQCTGGASAGSIAPTPTFQTVCIPGGQYRTFNATAGVTYTFSFCQGGGASTFDTQISILDNSGVFVPGAYNDDNCGQASELIFLAPASATFRILITKYGCLADATCQTLAYKTTVPSNDNICGATYLYSNACSLNYATYTTSLATTSPQANPGCAHYNGRDVWFSTKVPSSGKVLVTTNSGQITDGALAIYKGTSCSSSLTLLDCDDDDGPGSMPEINLTGLTPGDSLFIRFWTYDNTDVGTFSIAIRDQDPYYCMMGQSSEINQSGNCIQLTPNKRSQIGCVWNTTQINMSSVFDYTYTVNLGNNDGGADGMTFTLQNNPAGLNACGNPGSALAIGPLLNTFIIEFDTFNNGAGAADIAEDHIAIDVNGNLATPVAGPIQASSTNVNIEDGADHTVRITWNPGTTLFSIYFDGVLRLTYNNNIIASVFGGNPMVYWGFTSSTGTFTNTQSLCPGTLPGAPAPVDLGRFDVYVMNREVNLIWGTYSEKNAKEFSIERSADGKTFEAIGSVPAHGNSSEVINYSFIDGFPLANKSYYRLKQVDFDGAFVYSIIRVVDNSNNASGEVFQIYPNPSSSSSNININLSEDARVEIYDQSQLLLYEENAVAGVGVLNTQSIHFAPGIYNVRVRSSKGVQYTKLVIL